MFLTFGARLPGGGGRQGHLPTNHQPEGHTNRKEGRVEGHDGPSFVEEEYVGYRDRGDGFGGSSPEAHNDAGGQKAAKRLVEDCPYSTDEVDGITEDVGGTAPVLVRDGHPDEVTGSLEQGGRGEKVGDLGDVGSEAGRVHGGRGVREEVQGGLDYSNGRAGGQEIAPEHSNANQGSDAFLVPFWPLGVGQQGRRSRELFPHNSPVQRVVGIAGWRGDEEHLFGLVVTETDISKRFPPRLPQLGKVVVPGPRAGRDAGGRHVARLVESTDQGERPSTLNAAWVRAEGC